MGGYKYSGLYSFIEVKFELIKIKSYREIGSIFTFLLWRFIPVQILFYLFALCYPLMLKLNYLRVLWK